MPRYTLEEKAVLDILKAVSDINLDPGYTAMYLNQSMGPAMRVLEEVLRLSGYHKMGRGDEALAAEDNGEEGPAWRVPSELDENVTAFELRAEILGQLWLEYRSEPMLSELLEYSDLGFPLAYAYTNGLIGLSEQSANFIAETFSLLLESMGEEPNKIYHDVEDFIEDLDAWIEAGISSEEHDLGEDEESDSDEFEVEGSEDEEDYEDEDEILIEEYDSDLAYMDYMAKQKGILNDSDPENDYKI
jgi:hypothetical protein